MQYGQPWSATKVMQMQVGTGRHKISSTKAESMFRRMRPNCPGDCHDRDNDRFSGFWQLRNGLLFWSAATIPRSGSDTALGRPPVSHDAMRSKAPSPLRSAGAVQKGCVRRMLVRSGNHFGKTRRLFWSAVAIPRSGSDTALGRPPVHTRRRDRKRRRRCALPAQSKKGFS